MGPPPSVASGVLLEHMVWYQLVRSEWRDPEFRGLCVFATMLLLFS